MPKLKNQTIWDNLENNLKDYARIKQQQEDIKAMQDRLKAEIISDMDSLGIKAHDVEDATDEYIKNIHCTLIQPTEVIFDLQAVKRDIPAAVDYTTTLSLDDEQHIAAFKLKLKEYGVSDKKIRDLINTTMTITSTETVNEKTMQRKFDKGLIDDMSKYAKIINKPKYIKTTVSEKAADV